MKNILIKLRDVFFSGPLTWKLKSSTAYEFCGSKENSIIQVNAFFHQAEK
jgi:hypothetical protein